MLLLKRLIVVTKDTGFSKIKTIGAYFWEIEAVILLLLKRLIVVTKDTGFSKRKTIGAYF